MLAACSSSWVHPAVQEQVLGLVSQGVNVRARVLWHHDEPGCARPRLWRATRVVAMQKVVEAWRMGWMRRRAREPRLFQIEDPGGSERLDEAGHYSR